MGRGRGTEAVMGKATAAGGAQLSFLSLIRTVLFSVTVFAAVQHGGPEDPEEGVVPVPFRVTALVTAAVSRRPAKRKRRFLTYTDRAVGFPKVGMAGGGHTKVTGELSQLRNHPETVGASVQMKPAAVGSMGSPWKH